MIPAKTMHPAFGVFVCYRREDTSPYARLLKLQLSARLPGTSVFLDQDCIEPGCDFAEAIGSALRSCSVLVALIGPRWLTALDEGGRRRFDDPDDCTRFEIRTALEHCDRVIPVLVEGATMPGRQQLPADLRALARLNALEMSCRRFEYDEGRLLAAIQRTLFPMTSLGDGEDASPSPARGWRRGC